MRHGVEGAADVSVPAKRWQQLADDLEFEQLAGARKQAEGWRAGLTGLTALLAAVTIVKGPDSVSALADWARYTVVGLIALAFGLLVAGTLAAVRAAAGNPGAAIYLDGEELQKWTFAEAASVQRDIVRASRRMVIGLVALGLALGLTWLAPAKEAKPGLVTVERDGLRACGPLVAIDGRTIVLGNPTRAIALDLTTRVSPVAKC